MARFAAQVVLCVKSRRKSHRQSPQGQFDHLSPEHRTTEIHPYSTCISGLWRTSKADVLRNSESPVSWAGLLPQSECQSSGISRQIFKILKLYPHRISGRKRECVKVEVRYMVAFHTVPVKNSMAFCVKS